MRIILLDSSIGDDLPHVIFKKKKKERFSFDIQVCYEIALFILELLTFLFFILSYYNIDVEYQLVFFVND